jgi:riboflavin-specific deaminase-like protein
MRQLIPTEMHLALDATYRGLTLAARPGRPWVAIGMVSSVDGGAAVDGATESLGGAADRVAFRRLRDAADAILVGAGTVRDEHYGPPIATEGRRRDRVARGLSEVPRLVIVSGRLALDAGHRVFSRPDLRPLVATSGSTPESDVRRLQSVADVIRVGERGVDVAELVASLPSFGLGRILCEGGPTLNAALLEADLVDEVFLTLTPSLLGGVAPRIVGDRGRHPPRDLELVEAHEHDGELLLRYRRTR